MKTFDLVKLPEKEASALMWIRMSLLSALISEHRFLIFHGANSSQRRIFERDYETENEEIFHGITKCDIFENIPANIDLESLRLQRSETLHHDDDDFLVFGHSMQEIKDNILDFCGECSSKTPQQRLGFQIGLPDRKLNATVRTKTTDAEPAYITIELEGYVFSNSDFNMVSLNRETDEGFYSMSFSSHENLVYYDVYNRDQRERNSLSLPMQASRLLKHLLNRSEPAK